MVSKMSGDSRKRQILRQQASSVSNAVWPARVQRYIETNRAAQHRRLFLMKEPGRRSRLFSYASFYIHDKPMLLKLYSHLLVALLTGSLILMASLLYEWSILFIVPALCLVTCAVALQLIFADQPARTSIASDQQPASTELPRPPSLAFDFPETPMPATPLIRVLETIDLSASNVEHFITPPPSTQLPAEFSGVETLTSPEQEYQDS